MAHLGFGDSLTDKVRSRSASAERPVKSFRSFTRPVPDSLLFRFMWPADAVRWQKRLRIFVYNGLHKALIDVCKPDFITWDIFDELLSSATLKVNQYRVGQKSSSYVGCVNSHRGQRIRPAAIFPPRKTDSSKHLE